MGTLEKATYDVSVFGDGLISMGRVMRHYEELHPEYRVTRVSKFRIDHDTQTVNIDMWVTPKAAKKDSESPALLSPGYDELKRNFTLLTARLEAAEIQIAEFKKGAEGRPCLCGKCADDLEHEYESRPKLGPDIDDMVETGSDTNTFDAIVSKACDQAEIVGPDEGEFNGR